MKTITISEVNNGFKLKISSDTDVEYVYRGVDLLVMLEFVGKQLLGKKIKVQES